MYQPKVAMAGMRPISSGDLVKVAAKTGTMVVMEPNPSPKMKNIRSSVATVTLWRKCFATGAGTSSSGRIVIKPEINDRKRFAIKKSKPLL